jgi:hypothetical protein
MKRQIKTGATGPRGPRSARAATVLTERRRKVGKPRKNKPKGLRPSRQQIELLEMIVRHFDDVYQQLNEHLKLIATIRQQVNGLIASASRLSKP